MLALGAFFGMVYTSSAQVNSVDELNPNFLNWQNQDLTTDQKLGVSMNKAYESLLKHKKSKKKVIVAVIDSGVDIEHEDLKGKIWTNKGEIPDNQIDDDNNGYVDDVHGWNFLGNKSGENIEFEHYEYVRIVKQGDKNHPEYNKSKRLYDEELEKQQKIRDRYAKFLKVMNEAKTIIKDNTGIVVKSKDDLHKVNGATNTQVAKAKTFLLKRYNLGFTEELFTKVKEYNDHKLDYNLNLEFDARSIIGDDPLNLDDRGYGNPDVKGVGADHGTGVAGLIAAARNNEIGINGIATDVEIMAIRAVPNGDERDKDVALAIRYAVDHGADIINMSFGKQFSPNKKFVDEAIKYAEEKGVLLVVSSGNSAQNLDEDMSFPNAHYANGSVASNFLYVGATQQLLDKQVPAEFSNFGKTEVDIFAPGVNIISLDVDNTYSKHDGTSFSSPIVSGIAAVILAYYPEITPKEMISLLMESSYKVEKPKKVLSPAVNAKGKRLKVSFSALSKCGGIVNAYRALVLAEEQFGDNKL